MHKVTGSTQRFVEKLQRVDKDNVRTFYRIEHTETHLGPFDGHSMCSSELPYEMPGPYDEFGNFWHQLIPFAMQTCCFAFHTLDDLLYWFPDTVLDNLFNKGFDIVEIQGIAILQSDSQAVILRCDNHLNQLNQ